MRWIRSASSSTSSRMCDDTRIVRPSAPEAADHVAQVEPLRRDRCRRAARRARAAAGRARGSPRAASAAACRGSSRAAADLRDSTRSTVSIARSDGAVDVVDALQARVQLDEPAAASGSRRPTRARACSRSAGTGAGLPAYRLAEDRAPCPATAASGRRSRGAASSCRRRSGRGAPSRRARPTSETSLTATTPANHFDSAVDDDRGRRVVARHPRSEPRRPAHQQRGERDRQPDEPEQRHPSGQRPLDVVAEDPVDGVGRAPAACSRARARPRREPVKLSSAIPPIAEPMNRTARIATDAYARRVANDATNSARVVSTAATVAPAARNRGTTSQLSARNDPGCSGVEHVPREEDRLGQPGGRQRDREERGPPGADVVERRDRPSGVEREHAVPPVGADEERGDDGREEAEGHHRPVVVVAVRRKLEVVRRSAERPTNAETTTRTRIGTRASPSRSQGAIFAPAPRPSPSEIRIAVRPDRPPPVPATGPLSLVALVAEVEDLGGPGRHVASASSSGASGGSDTKTSASECRAGASRYRSASDSTITSRSVS